METLTLIHTSPVEIKEITKNGVFGDILFFASEEYHMGKTSHVYSLEVGEDKIINMTQLKDEKIIQEILDDLEGMKLTQEPDLELAESILDGSQYLLDLIPEDQMEYGCGDYSEYLWDIQTYQGRCAKKMGYEVCQSFDEQGTVWIVPMMGRENDLTLVREC